MYSDDENLYNCTPPEVREDAEAAVGSLLPVKSAARYEKAYDAFLEWCKTKKIKNYTENCLLAYFKDISEHKKSIWSIYSMVKSCLSIKHNLDISKYPKLIAFLKRTTEHHNPKKSRILDEQQILKFISDAPDTTCILMKVVLIIGISGACRREELCKMLTHHLIPKDEIIIISVPETKTGVKREFVIVKAEWVKIIKNFLQIRLLVKTNTERLFLTFRGGKCINSPVGLNTIGKIPSEIAKYLNLPNPHEFTGHCFRRSSATLLANKGADFLAVKRHGG
ncbi:hypothetical protein RI129_001195 [Pyrocoelia pectoralis]|uniref:Tyr recombinase domain-containing protein n=1 Tax=Pyrocoelia pectoralis TaxID=417401 RepID=A0AAN7ZX03_9COLE